MEKIKTLCKTIACLPILAYQVLFSYGTKPSCRFFPTCSTYTLEAIQQVGVIKGLGLGLYRILRCHPWSSGGYDPVLPKKEKS